MRKTLGHLHLTGPHGDAQCSALQGSPLPVTILLRISPPSFLGERRPEANPSTTAIQSLSGEHRRAVTAAGRDAFELGLTPARWQTPGAKPGSHRSSTPSEPSKY